MKKFLMSVALMAAVAVSYLMTGSDESEVNVSDLTSANVEALAQIVIIGPICAETCTGCYCEYDDGLKIKGAMQQIEYY
ncbi:MAG: hypothetical protein ILA03_06700 [Bacteroidaceae bacterium]|nr:hypothetical protein [Bacteroidaceae bacterium]MBQ9675757.1 hypothetical protein [Bacteroidaceae bacterium]